MIHGTETEYSIIIGRTHALLARQDKLCTSVAKIGVGKDSWAEVTVPVSLSRCRHKEGKYLLWHVMRLKRRAAFVRNPQKTFAFKRWRKNGKVGVPFTAIKLELRTLYSIVN